MDMTWRKSSYSSGNGGNCVEVGTWRKSSHSTTNGGACVEVGVRRELSHSAGDGGGGVEAVTAAADNSNKRVALGGAVHKAPWRTSTHSTTNGGACVETATISATVAVRDTKDHGDGPVLRFTPRAWQAFTTTLK